MPASTIRQFPLAAGIAEGADPKQLPPGTLATLENCVWRKTNRIEKRYGTRQLGSASVASVLRMITRGTELAVTDGSHIYSYVSPAQLWADRGTIPELGATWSTATETMRGVIGADVSLVGSYLVRAWVDGVGDIYVQISDSASGSVIVPASRVVTSTTATSVRLVTNGTMAVLVYMSGASNANLCAYAFTPGPTLTGTVTTLETDGYSAYGTASVVPLDACVIGSLFVVAYSANPHGLQLRSFSFASTPVLQASALVYAEVSTDIFSISIDGSASDKLYVLYAQGTAKTIRLAVCYSNTLATVSPTTVIQTFTTTSYSASVAILHLAAGGALLTYSWYDSGNYAGQLFCQTCDSTGALTGYVMQTGCMRLLSRPFAFGSKTYVFAGSYFDAHGYGYNTTQPLPEGSDSFVIEIDPSTTSATVAREAAKIDVLTAGAWLVGSPTAFVAGTLPNVPASGTVAYAVTPSVVDARPVMPGFIFQGLKSVTLSLGSSTPPDMWRCAQVGPEAYCAAGVLAAYDGQIATPYGFAHAALIDVAESIASTSGGALVPGTYLYCTVPERRSAAGILHRGPTAVTISETIGGTMGSGSVTLKVSPVHISVCAEPTQVAVYRSVVGGSVPQRLTVEPSTNVLDNSLASPLTLVDVTPDASVMRVGLAERPALYTVGGELDDMQPPALLTIIAHRNRLFGLAGDGQTVWLSKDYSTNVGTAPGFHPDLTIYFPKPLVALASMDDKLVGLSATRPYVVIGDGPGPDGSNSDYTAPQPVAADVGCSSARSVVTTPAGIMFLSTRGFMLLSRGLELSRVGAPVQDTLASFPVCTSAVIVPAQNQVRWTMNSADGTSGRVLVYDYVVGQWSVFRYADGAVADTAIVDAVLWNGAWTFATPRGNVYSEDSTTYRDSGTSFVVARGAIAWLDEAGPLGFMHVRRAFLLGDLLSSCALTLSFGFDYASADVQSYTWSASALSAIASANVGMRVGSQNGASPRCTAFRVSWSDADGVGGDNGAGFNLSAIGIEYVPKPEMARRGARARA